MGQTHRHGVIGFLDPDPHRRRPVEAAGVVIQLAILRGGQHEGRVENQGRRRVAVIERGEIDERLKRRTRLPLGLGHAVEHALLEAITALHRQNAARARVDRDDSALDVRDLAQREGLALVIQRLDRHDVAGAQNIAGLFRSCADLLFLQGRLGPFQLSHRDVGALAIDEADRRRVLRRLQHDGQFPT